MDDPEQLREAAIKRLAARRDFWTHVLLYGLVNLMLVVAWALTGQGYFWPFWSLTGWGIALAMHAWTVFFQKPISEEEIRREIEKAKASLRS